ncbi:MAG TPA: phage tail protein [Bryobacteraceae bacterium]
MAVLRSHPYGNQNFLVDLGTGTISGPEAAFCEVILPGISIDVTEYRTGGDKENGVTKLAGLARYPDVTLRRGVVGSLDLYKWIDDVRNGSPNSRRTVTIQLLAEDRTPVLTWKLLRAWPSKLAGPDLNAKGTDVAMEELVLSYERLEME